MDIAIIWPDGQRRDILVNTTPISNGSGLITSAVGAFSGITELNAQRNALGKPHEEMEKRVEERTDELLALNKSLEVEISKDDDHGDGCVSRFDYE